MITHRRPARPGLAPLRPHGFSLLELVIVMAVFAILATTAVSSYREYVQRAHRADAIRLVLGVAACQETVRADIGAYDTTRCLEAAGTPSHRLRIDPPDRAATLSYVIVAELREGWDDVCGDLSLDQAGVRGIGGPAGRLARCWGGR